jgi:hypothetical protein
MSDKLLHEEINEIKLNLTELKKQLLLKMITEGVDDPGILKCCIYGRWPRLG